MKSLFFQPFSVLVIFQILGFAGISCTKSTDVTVHISGAMRNTMWKGELAGIVSLDSLLLKPNLYGMGPAAYLSGEILVLEGIVYVSKVTSDSSMTVEVVQISEAPFFAYANINSWKNIKLPDSVQSLLQLEQFLLQEIGEQQPPLLFKLSGNISEGIIHVVNLPAGKIVRSPEDAHMGKTNYSVSHSEVEILGFFSTKHKGIFTHHNTFLHLHLITKDRLKMGHLDELFWKSGAMKLEIARN